MQKLFLAPLVRQPGKSWALHNTRNGQVVAERLLAAFDSETRRKGLLGRDGLGDGEGLVIAPSNAVHTFFMRFPIDIAFVTRAGIVVKVRHDVPAWRLSGSLGAYAVVELPAGTLARCETNVGDALMLSENT